MKIPRARLRNLFATKFWILILAVTFGVVCPLRGEEVAPIAEGTGALYRGEYEQARTLATQYLDAHPEASAALILLARAEIAQGQYESAYASLRRALDFEPANLDALYYLERICTILSQIELRRLVEAAPDSFRARQLMAESYLAQHENKNAEVEYQAALNANPESVEVLDGLGELKRSEFKFAEALIYYTRAAKLAPRDYTSAYGSGACHLFLQNPQRAIESFRRAIAIDREAAAAHLALGDALLRSGQAPAAVAEFKATIALAPSMRQAYTLLARAYQKLGQNREAERALAHEHELARKDVEAREAALESGEASGQPRPLRPQEIQPSSPKP